jgi:cell division protein FtsW
VEANGAQRALELGSYTIQPAEMIKLAVVVWLARIMAKHQMSGGVTTKGVVLSAVIVLFFSGLVFKNGLTNMILIMCVSVSMFIIGGIQWRKLGIVMLCYGVLGGGFAYHHFSDKKADKDEFTTTQTVENENDVKIDRSGTQKGRIARFLEGVTPNDTITDENRQVMYANFALAHGGLLGQGPGNSRESARVPLAFSDYIYSIVVEEIGFVGGALLLVIYLLLVARAGAIASKCSRAFPALLIMGCAVLIAFQALVHMAIVTGFFPVSGQPLPLISKGGTSIMIMSLAIGMMLSVSKYAVRSGNKKEIRKELGELPDEMKSANPTEIRKD